MGRKAKHGGTLGRAPLGYRNVMEQFEDRTIRSVAIDQEPAPFVARSCTPAVARVWHTF
jgi:site-specific DNA recombinase